MKKNDLKTVPKKRWGTVKALIAKQFGDSLEDDKDYICIIREEDCPKKKWAKVRDGVIKIADDNRMLSISRETDGDIMCSATGERAYCTDHGEAIAIVVCHCAGMIMKPLRVCEHHLYVHMRHSTRCKVIKWLKKEY